MGRALAETFPDSRDFWKMAEKASGFPLREIYWDGEEAAQAETRYLQPAMTVVNVSLWAFLKARSADKLEAVCLAGHSLGEFAALAAARVLDLADAFSLVSLRGRLMAEGGRPGQSMAAVLKLALADVNEVVEAARQATNLELRVANHNSPGQYVLSGQTPAIEAAAPLVKERKGRLVPLAVSGAFHSPLMAEPAKEFIAALAKVDLKDARLPVVMNVTGQAESRAGLLRDLMGRQMTSSVLWTDSMAAMWSAGARRYLELGPKGVLTRLVKPNLDAAAGPGAEYEALAFAG